MLDKGLRACAACWFSGGTSGVLVSWVLEVGAHLLSGLRRPRDTRGSHQPPELVGPLATAAATAVAHSTDGDRRE